ncbi:PA0069 family radical SAM protein [Sphingobacterium shayense]|uniref:PA0069 family radical SAM protein n=1 Tax=Sphingobacterium shayense TaxID=626343 RepID=UPI001553236E|nr:PA0069 family radical SAM protein [Sphingobacterium shayense]NQD72519.1 PA0069 family radical SAM protein [Sphingobacterium shayense]
MVSNNNDEYYFKGRGAQVNPNNKFFQHEYSQEFQEGLDEPFLESSKTVIIYSYPKTIISKVNSPDIGFSKSLNPYQGCEHGCVYCYARNSHEYWGYSAGLDFERKIIVKQNAIDLLKQEFEKKHYDPQTIFLSGNTDCYQPIERKFKITRGILKTMLAYKHPVSIISKNVLMFRDIDIIQELASLGLVSVTVTINSLNEDVRRKMEPRTATAGARLKLIESFANRNIPVSVLIAPIVPGINSMEMADIIKEAANVGAVWAGYTIVRLNGAVSHIFCDWVHKNYPDAAEKIIHGIKECHGGQLNDSEWGRRIAGDGKIAEGIKQLFRLARKKHMGDCAPPVLRNDLFVSPTRPVQLRLF